MILEKQIEANILQEGEISQDSIGMSLDLDSAQVLMQMLSKNLYSDSVGSTVRECASNALDSHRRAGVTKPIIVSFRSNKDDNYEFSVEDFGIGLDADDVKNIISKYGKSTKRDSSTELGMMGLGFKAPLAYSSSFYFVCRKNGVERKYMMYEGEDTNTIDLLYEAPTDQCNGVKVIVPVKYHDRHEFQTKISEQLAYFEDVYFDVPNMKNEFSIIRAEHFQISPLVSNSYMHICLDNVYYPLDFAKLGIDDIRMSIGLRFSLTDGIFPTPNRESIRYTKEAKEIIINKIRVVADYFANKYNENISAVSDLKDVIDYYGDSTRYVKVGEQQYSIDRLLKHSSVQLNSPVMEGVSLIPLERFYKMREYILGEYKVMSEYQGDRMRDISSHRYAYWDFRVDKITNDQWFIYDLPFKQNKKNYMKSTFKTEKYKKRFFLKKTAPFKLMNKTGAHDCYYHMLNLQNYPKSQWRAVIQEFQYALSTVTKKFIDLDRIDIPKEWLDAQKKSRPKITSTTSSDGTRRVKLKGEIVGKRSEKLERWVSGQNCKFVKVIYKMEEMHRINKLNIYGSAADQAKLDKLYTIYGSKLNLVIFSDRELNNMKNVEVPNWISINKFMEGKHKLFKRAVTAKLIDDLVSSNRPVFHKKHLLKDVSSDLYKKLGELEEYRREWFLDGDATLYKELIQIAEEGCGFDPAIYSTYVEIKSFLEKHSFLQTLFDFIPSWNNDGKQIIIDLLKYHKHRVDWKNYNIRLNEEIVTPISQELIEQI